MSDAVSAVGEVAKDAAPYVTMSTGAGMTQIPISWIQIAGVLIGTGGLLVALLRWREAKRANDLNQIKWEHERAESINNEETKAEERLQRKHGKEETQGKTNQDSKSKEKAEA